MQLFTSAVPVCLQAKFVSQPTGIHPDVRELKQLIIAGEKQL